MVHMMPHDLAGDMGGGMTMPMPEMMISNPDVTKGILLTPGERADVVFTPTGRDISIEWHDFKRGRHTAQYNEDGTIGFGHAHNDGHAPPQTLLKIRTVGRHRGNGEYIPPPMLSTIEPIDAATAPAMPVMFGHTPPDANGDIVSFAQMKNGMPLPMSQVTAADAPTAQVGDRRVIEVNNMTSGHHNFHLHGFVFQHIETQFIDMDTPENNRTVPATHLENKDTIFIPRRSGAQGRSRTITRLALVVSDDGREGQIAASGKESRGDTSGGWLFHCHILEHSARGMMSFLQVLE
jgi:FtsP/CotA-like multicopper oxidase with cupredoxin domain